MQEILWKTYFKICWNTHGGVEETEIETASIRKEKQSLLFAKKSYFRGGNLEIENH